MYLTGDDILEMLLRVFPGPIIWHSYAYLNMKKNQHISSNKLNFSPVHTNLDLNRCFAYGNSMMKCAARGKDRVTFVNLQPLQARRISEYSDLIHHPGKISRDIVFSMLSILTDSTLQKTSSLKRSDSRINFQSSVNHTLIFALKQEAPNLRRNVQRGQNFWGLGDMVRGMLHSCQLAKKYDYSKFNVSLHEFSFSMIFFSLLMITPFLIISLSPILMCTTTS